MFNFILSVYFLLNRPFLACCCVEECHWEFALSKSSSRVQGDNKSFAMCMFLPGNLEASPEGLRLTNIYIYMCVCVCVGQITVKEDWWMRGKGAGNKIEFFVDSKTNFMPVKIGTNSFLLKANVKRNCPSFRKECSFQNPQDLSIRPEALLLYYFFKNSKL